MDINSHDILNSSNNADAGYIRPETAERKIKAASEKNQTVYIYGVTGSGKTSLVSSILYHKKYLYYSAALTDPLDIEMPQNNNHQNIIVIDDLYSVNKPELRLKYFEVIENITAKRDIWLILVSRSNMPKWLMPLHFRHIFSVIDERDLMLSGLQQEKYFENWGLGLSENILGSIRLIGGGNPLYLRMAAIELDKCKSQNAAKTQNDAEALEKAIYDVWDYFESYVYDKWDAELDNFMMKLSIVDSFDLKLAQVLTENTNAGSMLTLAEETGNFIIENDGTYTLRMPIKRSMLRRLMRKFNSDCINKLYYGAGQYYLENGRFPDAVQMFEKSGNTGKIFEVLKANSCKNQADGYYSELRRYYLRMPEEVIVDNPDMIAGMSMLQSVIMNEDESERWYGILKEYAGKIDKNRELKADRKLLYLDLNLPHRGIDNTQEILNRACDLNAGHGSINGIGNNGKDIFNVTFTDNQPSIINGSRDYSSWLKKDRDFTSQIAAGIEKALGYEGKCAFSIAVAESMFERGGEVREISNMLQEGQIMAESIGSGAQCFVADSIMSQIALFDGHIEDAISILDSLKKKIDRPERLKKSVDALKCRIRMYNGRSEENEQWLRNSPDENVEFCTSDRLFYLSKVRLYIQKGKYGMALGLLHKLLFYSQKMKRQYIHMEAMLLLSVVQARMDDGEWKSSLQSVVTKAEGYQFVRLITREGQAVSKMLKDKAIKWQDEGFRKMVIKECDNMALLYPAYLKEKSDDSIALSENAVKILRMQAEGLSVDEIAEALFITKNTVKYHNQETYKKLGVSGKTAAVQEARKRGII
jgi:LuxR family transcriptional regulator, maltose regulon positive regulatory protein